MKKHLLKLSIIFSAIFAPLSGYCQLQAGDMAILAYQTSAGANVNDEVAFVTFVQIPQGTEINFTDSKYTTNATAQCPNSLKWTAPSGGVPAGTIIRFKTDLIPLTVNVGTLTGVGMTDFGLSSGGDQVIVYTGTNASPTYITAFSSNAWEPAPYTTCNGSKSIRPAGLDATNSVSLSTATGNVSGVAINAFYNGTLSGTPAQLKASIYNPSNWTAGAKDVAQTWPTLNVVLGLFETKHSISALSLYPNPVKEGSSIHLNEEVSGEIMDFSGKVVMTFSKQDAVSIQGLNKGMYIIRTEAGAAGKLIVE